MEEAFDCLRFSSFISFEIQLAGTFSIMNNFGLELPTNLSPLQETQLSVLWYSIMSLIKIAIIIAHIYIGSVGMEGAIDAMGMAS